MHRSRTGKRIGRSGAGAAARSRRLTTLALLLPAMTLLGAFYIYPLLGILRISLVEPEPGFGN
jgi:ABC-type sugar transport system permease subunit